MKLLSILFTTCILLSTLHTVTAQDLSRYSIIPWPQHLEPQDGMFTLNENTLIILSDPAHEALRATAEFWADQVRVSSKLPLPIADAPADSGGTITFTLDETADTGPEGYRLNVSEEAVTLTATAPAGLFYGTQTLRQLMPVAVDRGGTVRGKDMTAWTIPAVTIEDAPRFGYRGILLDVARHFFPVSDIKKTLDLMALYKMNRFHWHLTEDQGWRIEIKKYPKLTEVGAYRKATLKGHYDNKPQAFDGQRYGGFYTQDEVREVVAYAQARHITIIPEIELPGHSLAALASYPELGCTEGPFEVSGRWGVHEDIYCPKEETFTFLENVLTEVMALFPSEYIHIGGDEAPKTRWKESEVAQAVMQREGLADEHELQSYFIRRIERFLNAHGRKIIGWDEIMEGGLSPTATLMFWRTWNKEALALAAEQGNDLIMTPTQSLYLDYYQGNPATEPLAIGGMVTLEKVYAYEPVPERYSEEEARQVTGAQANVWTEYIKTQQKLEYMIFPRILALSEVVWSQKEARNWFSFKGRLPANLSRLDVLTVNYRRPDWMR